MSSRRPVRFQRMKAGVGLVVFIIVIISFLAGIGRGPELETPIIIG
ncbi:hypothetical protein [Paenibacillus sambharensis]|nr:hypothetical protein [Paenibacillus sambharensis]